MTHGALGMLDTILKFQTGPDLEPTHRQPVFSILVLGTCTGRPRTHRTANDSVRKRLLRRRSYWRGGSFYLSTNKAFCGLLERGVNTGILNSEFGHASLIFGGAVEPRYFELG